VFDVYDEVHTLYTQEARMKNRFRLIGLVRASVLSLVLMGISSVAAHATVYVIKFGGSLGNVYSPNALSVAVGDTIQWQGAFTFHPLSSTTIPAGAQSWSASSSTTFSYVVSVPGTYNYQCDVHQPAMVGSFSTPLAGVSQGASDEVPVRIMLGQNYPNPFNPTTTIEYSIGAVSGQQSAASKVRLAVYDLLGREVALLADGSMLPGRYHATFNAAQLGSGMYIYKLTADGMSFARSMTLVK
jgi:plastocyanin